MIIGYKWKKTGEILYDKQDLIEYLEDLTGDMIPYDSINEIYEDYSINKNYQNINHQNEWEYVEVDRDSKQWKNRNVIHIRITSGWTATVRDLKSFKYLLKRITRVYDRYEWFNKNFGEISYIRDSTNPRFIRIVKQMIEQKKRELIETK
tara:strand:- start:37 stop:486 length:450 start_codon:yes stop_codon:yes gene_type:complete